jgi:UDP-N-acetylmuramate-alanine ligase
MRDRRIHDRRRRFGHERHCRVLVNLGYQVAAIRLRASAVTSASRSAASVFIGHAAQNIGRADVVVSSSAVDEENPEVVTARHLRIDSAGAEMLASDAIATASRSLAPMARPRRPV